MFIAINEPQFGLTRFAARRRRARLERLLRRVRALRDVAPAPVRYATLIAIEREIETRLSLSDSTLGPWRPRP